MWWNPFSWFDNVPAWGKVLIGVGVILLGAVVTVLTAGAGLGFMAAFGSALLTSTIQTGISVGISAAIGFVAGGLSTGSWSGAFEGMLNGAVDGLICGGIFSGGSQIIGGIMAKTAGIKIGRMEIGYKSDNSTTLLNISNKAGKSRFRIDVAAGKVKYPKGANGFLNGKTLTGLHYHFGKYNSLRNLHRFFTPGIVHGFWSSLNQWL